MCDQFDFNAETFYTGANFLAYGNKLYVNRTIDGALNAIANNDTVATAADQLIKNEDTFETQTFGDDIQFSAKYPGDIGNSLAINIIAAADSNLANVSAYSSIFLKNDDATYWSLLSDPPTTPGSITDSGLTIDTGNARMIIDGDAGNVFFNEIGNRGDLTFPMCSISNNGSGGNYLHAQFQGYGGAMFHIHYFGYDYSGTIRQGSAGGYVYNTSGQSGAYAAAISGHTAVVYQTTTNKIEVVINTGSSQAGNRWGSMVFFGGTDTITGNNPLALVQYAWDNSTSRYWSS